MSTNEEVEKNLKWNLQLSPLTLVEYKAFAKADYPRGVAWDFVPTLEGNPWRKSHTKNYWVWYRTEAP